MIHFKLNHVIGNWWTVTIGRSLDDIGYLVVADDGEHGGGFYRLEQLVALYECAKLERPTNDHPMRGGCGYTIVESDGPVEIDVTEGCYYETSYEELQQTLANFLGDVFSELDRISTPEQRDTGIDYLVARDDLLLDFREVYADLTENQR